MADTLRKRCMSFRRAHWYLNHAVTEHGSGMFSDGVMLRGVGIWEGGGVVLQTEIVVASAEERKFSTRMDVRGHLLSVQVSPTQKRPWAAIMSCGVGGGGGRERQDASACWRAQRLGWW
jgi:hypothetical protein